MDSFAHETITVSTVAVGLTTAVHAPASGAAAQRAVIAVEGADIRFWTDAVAPTASVGVLLKNGQLLTLDGQNDLRGLRMIRQAAVDAVVSVVYLR